MLRMLRRALPAAMILTLAMVGSAQAATSQVSIVNFAFNPTPLTVTMGDTVNWTNNAGGTSHTTTSDTTNPDGTPGVHWWNSGTLGNLAQFPFVFTAAGTFTYHCAIHPTTMKAIVKISPKVSPKSGAAGTMFKITIATVTAPANFTYTVQISELGGAFVNFMVGVTATKVTFDSTGKAPGTYRFRSRLNTTLAPAGASEFSPAKSVRVS